MLRRAGNLGRPADCSTGCRRRNVVRCDEAAWRFLGLSLAGYNVLISAGAGGWSRCGRARRVGSAYGSSSVSQ